MMPLKSLELFFKGLADNTRLRILNILLHSSSVKVTDLVETLGLPQSTVSRHLAYLKHSGWVEDRRVDKWVYYRIARDIPESLLHALKELFALEIKFQDDRKKIESY